MNNRAPMPSLPARSSAWSYWVAAIAGLLLLFGPSLFGYDDTQRGFWTSAVLGTVISILGIWGGLSRRPGPWKRIVLVVLGVLSIVAPFVLQVSRNRYALLSFVILGAITAIASGIGLLARPANPAA